MFVALTFQSYLLDRLEFLASKLQFRTHDERMSYWDWGFTRYPLLKLLVLYPAFGSMVHFPAIYGGNRLPEDSVNQLYADLR